MAAVTILYCPVWGGYDKRAASLAVEINAKTQHRAEIREGVKSQFDVLVDGALVFSKQAEGRFPEPDEILSRL